MCDPQPIKLEPERQLSQPQAEDDTARPQRGGQELSASDSIDDGEHRSHVR
jgi:hypothetical protein